MRRIVTSYLAALISLIGVYLVGMEPVSAQNQVPSVVQLPTFSFFTFRGTVVVPDSGGAYLGGNKTSAMGSSRQGGWQRSFGAIQGNRGASIHAHIIDHNELDRQLLGGSPEQFLREQRLAEAARSKQRAVDPDEEGKSLVRHARKLYQKGDQTGSFDTYRMAIGVLKSNRLKDLAKVEFRRVFGAAADQSLKMASLRR